MYRFEIAKNCVIKILFSSGNQNPDGNEWFMSHHYGIQVFDLSVDQICSLLQNTESDKGIEQTYFFLKLLLFLLKFLFFIFFFIFTNYHNYMAQSLSFPSLLLSSCGHCKTGDSSDCPVPSDGWRKVLPLHLQRGI